MAQQSHAGATADRILDVAERLAQSRGFNGFSYADVANELDLTKAALHYHFPGKAELGIALITRYAQRFMAALATIDTLGDPRAELEAYAQLYLDVLNDRRMCLCGMLAAEYQTLPEPMQDVVIAFFNDNERWLAAVLDDGRTQGTLTFAGTSQATARMIVGGLEGAMLVARIHHDPNRFKASADRLLNSLTTRHQSPGRGVRISRG
jgi:TetR/AcrR family transcriptional repressor of nem operon